MEARNVQGIKVTVKGGGTCIYCGSDGGNDGLRSEHVIPFSLGGNAELLEASCKECEGITGYLDGYLANATFREFRVHVGVQSRSGHAESLPANVKLPDGEKVIDLATADHPYFTHMPVWKAPNILYGHQSSPDFGVTKTHLYWYAPPNIRETLGIKDGDLAEIRDRTRMPNVKTFARGIAKIAYCHEIMNYGLDGFKSLAITDLILGRYPHIPYLVGSSLNNPPPPDGQNVMHAVKCQDAALGHLKLINVSLRLFANSGTAENGMPIYHVVVGAPGKSVAISRRASPKTPKIIRL